MSEIFWETTQRARCEHRCDYCDSWIERGNEYSRWIWAPRGAERFHVMKCHSSPSCPMPDDEVERKYNREMVRRADEVEYTVQLEVRVVDVVLIQLDGSPITEQELEIVPVVVPVVEQYDDSLEEIPF